MMGPYAAEWLRAPACAATSDVGPVRRQVEDQTHRRQNVRHNGTV